MKLAWITDIHLNFLEEEHRLTFYEDLKKSDSEAIVISGDIAESSQVGWILSEMAKMLQRPIYFVVGNHDYYRSKVYEVRNNLRSLTEQNPRLFWLGASDPIILEPATILVGSDGWADGRYGNYLKSPVVLNDSRLIIDLFEGRIVGKKQLLSKMQTLADDDAKYLAAQLKKATEKKFKKIMVVTHVPPFPEACMYAGKLTDDDYLPFYSSKATGDVLLRFAKANKDKHFLVLCGHTHHRCLYQPLENLIVKVGQAEYRSPALEEVIDTNNI